MDALTSSGTDFISGITDGAAFRPGAWGPQTDTVPEVPFHPEAHDAFVSWASRVSCR